jgi:hypothetical protein
VKNLNDKLSKYDREHQFELIKTILEFYSNLDDENFSNISCRQGCSEEMIYARLGRAAMDEVESNCIATSSRYAIWAADVGELLEKIKISIESENISEAHRLLNISLNSINAYKDIQSMLDYTNDFFKFESPEVTLGRYIEYSLSKNTTIISKSEIVKKLKKSTVNKGVRIPRDIDLYIKNGVLFMKVLHPERNMQDDSAAFEGWIIILLRWLSTEIRYVSFDYDKPDGVIAGRTGDSVNCHFNRFLYRLNNFKTLFPDKFFITNEKELEVKEFIEWLKKERCLINHSLRERKSVIETDKMERQIESWLVYADGKEQLCSKASIDPKKLFNQLPVGLFHKDILAKNAIFTRGASAIDLWGVGEDNETIHIIELKCGNNLKVGVISETLFYTAMIYDVCVNPDGWFSFGHYKKTAESNDMKALYNNGIKFKNLFVHIMVEKLHVLIDEKTEEILNNALSRKNISFDRIHYDYEKRQVF